LFFSTVVKPYFRVTDHWVRWEWQKRGSGHVHLFIWVKDQPDVEKLKFRERGAREPTADERAFCAFWDRYCRADQHDADARAAKSPSARSDAEIDESVATDVPESLNNYQMHSKCRAGPC
jgi:hypothetical protein